MASEQQQKRLGKFLSVILARAAWQAGVKLYRPEERLYLSPAIPAEFIEEEDLSCDNERHPDRPASGRAPDG